MNVTKLGLENGKMVSASKYGQDDVKSDVGEITAEEQSIVQLIKSVWESILHTDIEEQTDFFKSGAGSMDVTRLVEEVQDKINNSNFELTNEDVYMATSFEDFWRLVIVKLRGGGSGPKLVFEPVTLKANNRTVSFPNQIFINNQFINSSNPTKTLKSMNPADESLICEVQASTKEDVDKAVRAAEEAFTYGI